MVLSTTTTHTHTQKNHFYFFIFCFVVDYFSNHRFIVRRLVFTDSTFCLRYNLFLLLKTQIQQKSIITTTSLEKKTDKMASFWHFFVFSSFNCAAISWNLAPVTSQKHDQPPNPINHTLLMQSSKFNSRKLVWKLGKTS